MSPRYRYGDPWWLDDEKEGSEDTSKNKRWQTLIFVSWSVACIVASAQKGRGVWSASPAMVAESPTIPLLALILCRLFALIFACVVCVKYTLAPYVTVAWENLDGTRGIREGTGSNVVGPSSGIATP